MIYSLVFWTPSHSGDHSELLNPPICNIGEIYSMCMSTPDLATLMSDADLMELRPRLQPRRRCRRVPPHIPPPVHEPPIERVDTCNKRRVYFDLETTGLGIVFSTKVTNNLGN